VQDQWDVRREGVPGAVSALTIREIETIRIRVPLGKTYSGSYYRMTHRSTIVTRLHTDEGVVGVGYAGDEDATLEQIDAVIHEEIAPKLIGLDAFAVEKIWELAYPVTFDLLRDKRVGLVACSSIDTPVWDAVGNALGQPLWRLWGGYRDRVPIISIGGYYGTGIGLEEEVLELASSGFAGMKLKVGGQSPEEDAKRVRAARRVAGDDFVLTVDANQGWRPQDAIRFARLVEDCDVFWFEEPCRWHNDRLAMRDVRFAGGIRVCAGQSEYSAAACRDLMAAGAIDFCNFDASWSGGATEWRRVAAIAHVFDVRMAHHEEPQISSHLLASIPHGTFTEVFHPDRDPIWWKMIANRPPIEDSSIALPTSAGLGWELDWDFVEAHQVASSRRTTGEKAT
jgi:D-galactarolactone cycloisomerase